MEEDAAPPDEELVAAARSGHPEAFDELVRRHTPRLYGLVYNMTSNHEDTHDLLQEVFAKAYRSLKGFRGQSSFSTWIHTIAVNRTLNFLKKRGRQRAMSLDEMDPAAMDDPAFRSAVRSPEKEAGLKELQKRLNEALQKLSPKHRAVVTMFDIQGMPHAEIAKVMGISEGTVRSRLYYAHQQLQALLADYRP